MPDVVSPAKRSLMMAGIKGKNIKPEIVFRKALHALGLRFRLHNRLLPGKADIVLCKYQAVIFINGCFWHGYEHCKDFRLPKSNIDFWRCKIEENIKRDKKREMISML
jgi:DNA mismatch endonuclease (patch repair protein)